MSGCCNALTNQKFTQCEQCTKSQAGLDIFHTLLHHLPPELVLQIVEHVVVQQPCIKHIYDKCTSPWACMDGAHPYHNRGLRSRSHLHSDARYPVLPSPCVTSTRDLFNEEAHRAFFRHNTFVFDNQGVAESADTVVGPLATRFLDFIDRPEWSARGSPHFQSSHDRKVYRDIDAYRHQIQHLAFDASTPSRDDVLEGWEWQFSVDWKSLPRLQTLCLDLRPYLRRQQQGYSARSRHAQEMLATASENLACLKLKLLVIVGLVVMVPENVQFYGDVAGNVRLMDNLKKALVADGRLQVWGEPRVAW